MFLDLSGVTAASNQPLKPGTYAAKVEEAAVKPTKDGSGQYVQVMFKLTAEGEGKGRKVVHRFNIKNASAQAQQIGLSELKAMTVAAGVGDKLQSVNDLIGRDVLIRTAIKNDQPIIREFKSIKEQAPTAAAPQPKGFI